MGTRLVGQLVALADGDVRHARVREHEVHVLDGGAVLREDDSLAGHAVLVVAQSCQVDEQLHDLGARHHLE